VNEKLVIVFGWAAITLRKDTGHGYVVDEDAIGYIDKQIGPQSSPQILRRIGESLEDFLSRKITAGTFRRVHLAFQSRANPLD
jgi:hypothetical protein